MMRNYVNLLRNYFERQISGNKHPEFIPKGISSVSAITMVPDRSMRSHHNHAVYECNQEQRPAEIPKYEKEEEWSEAQNLKPANEREPVLSVSKNVETRKKLPQYLTRRRLY